MSNDLPQFFKWDAEHAVMVPRRPHYACMVYVDQQDYRLGVIEERSTNSHNHYFAAVNEAWRNLPDDQAERFPTSEHLRKYALIKAGYCDKQEFLASSKAEAVRIASFIRAAEEYAIVIVKDRAVVRMTPKSQAARAMSKQDFQDSKTKVLEIVSAMIGVSTGALETAGKAA